MIRVVRQEIRLTPDRNVRLESGRTIALDGDAWLRLELETPPSKAFAEVRFRSSLFDEPVRPVLRFITDEGPVERILPGPVAGTGIWRGPAPRGAQEVLVNPVTRAGRFDFTIDSWRWLSAREMLAYIIKNHPTRFPLALLYRCFVPEVSAGKWLERAAASESLEKFPIWLASREREFDPTGLDAPRFSWRDGPTFGVLIFVDGAPRRSVARTLLSLRGQIYPNLKVFAVSEQDRAADIFREACDDRVIWTKPGLAHERLEDVHYIGVVRPGHRLKEFALTCFAEELRRSPKTKLIYSDEIIEEELLHRPTFKPDWSPLLEASDPYIGSASFWNRELFPALFPLRDGKSFSRLTQPLMGRLARNDVAHLRRWLIVRPPEASPDRAPPPPARNQETGAEKPLSIILLTRDQPKLLQACARSVLERSLRRDFEFIIVDNGSTCAGAKAVFSSLARDPRVKILRRPEPFNFAKLANEAAAESSGEILVFLNDDTVVLTDDWLDQLAAHASQPNVGAVGALLLYPNGGIQHAGVVVGVMGEANHFAIKEKGDAWRNRKEHPREISAVTGACFAVAREKFWAIGGFDAEHLAVEFNDVDLCLRLKERGWISRYVPTIQLLHVESASRKKRGLLQTGPHKGKTESRAREEERAYFRSRWRHIIRDDPYFHPGLSLYAREPALW